MEVLAIVILIIFFYVVEELPAKRKEWREEEMSDYELDREKFNRKD